MDKLCDRLIWERFEAGRAGESRGGGVHLPGELDYEPGFRHFEYAFKWGCLMDRQTYLSNA